MLRSLLRAGICLFFWNSCLNLSTFGCSFKVRISSFSSVSIGVHSSPNKSLQSYPLWSELRNIWLCFDRMRCRPWCGTSSCFKGQSFGYSQIVLWEILYIITQFHWLWRYLWLLVPGKLSLTLGNEPQVGITARSLLRATVSSEFCGRTRSCVCTVLHFGQLQRRLSSERIKTEVSLADYISETVMGFINRTLEINTLYQNSPHL